MYILSFSCGGISSKIPTLQRDLLSSFYYESLLFWTNLEFSSSPDTDSLVNHVNITALDLSSILRLFSLITMQARFC